MDEVSFDEAHARFHGMVERVADGRERTVITRHGKRAVALVPVADVDMVEWREDRLEHRAVRRARKDIEKHGTISLADLKAKYGL